jgi:hypothetical protein
VPSDPKRPTKATFCESPKQGLSASFVGAPKHAALPAGAVMEFQPKR